MSVPNAAEMAHLSLETRFDQAFWRSRDGRAVYPTRVEMG